jgi:cytosine deaminase
MPDRTLIRNARLPVVFVGDPGAFGGRRDGDCAIADIVLDVEGMTAVPGGEASSDLPTIDLEGRLLLPRLVEAHCHLDKCHTIERLEGVGGSLLDAITVETEDRVHWTPEDIRRRATLGLEEAFAAGCDLLRSHVGWSPDDLPEGEAPLAWRVLGELAEDWAGRIELQRAALTPLELWDDDNYAETLAQRVAADGTVLGVFLYEQPRRRERLGKLFAIAARHDLPLDFHVDEGLSPDLDGLEMVADLVLETGFANPVVCGHACSLMNLQGAELERVTDKLLRAGIFVVCLPSTNLYLQDRQNGTPERRGLTRVRELAAAGVPIAFGSDNVADAFCPVGRHDPLASLALAILAAQLDPPYGAWLPTTTTVPRRALGGTVKSFEHLGPRELLVAEARHSAGLLSRAALRPLDEVISEQDLRLVGVGGMKR